MTPDDVREILARSRFRPRIAQAVELVLAHGRSVPEAMLACGIRHRQQVHQALDTVRARLANRCPHCGAPIKAGAKTTRSATVIDASDG